MFLRISFLLCMLAVVRSDDCAGLSLSSCLTSITCQWFPGQQKCFPMCIEYNSNVTCSAQAPRCSWGDFGCFSASLPCAQSSLTDCTIDNGCGVVLGNNTCQDCTSAKTKESCGMMSCYWIEESCISTLGICNHPKETCNDYGCYWKDSFDTCVIPDDETPLCQSPEDSNCIVWENSTLSSCSEATTYQHCKFEASCDWSFYSESCVDADICTRVPVSNCTDVGCVVVMSDVETLCTSAPAFTRCNQITDADKCNELKTCATIGENGKCGAVLSCHNLPKGVCNKKKECVWYGLAGGLCSSNSKTTTDSVSFQCDGKPCKNLLVKPDVSSFSFHFSFLEGQPAEVLWGLETHLYDAQENVCYNCPFCEPGYVTNLQSFVTVSHGHGSYTQEFCVKPNEYPKPDGPEPDSDGSSLSTGAIIGIVVGLVVVVGAIVTGVLLKGRKRRSYEGINDNNL